MKKVLYIIGGALCYLIFSVVLTSYDHKHTHKNLNISIAKSFVQKNLGLINKEEKFYNYQFGFETVDKLAGMEISEGGWDDVNESEASKNIIDWIAHGGFSADEPQLPASFRHFYDPTEEEGERYLKDLLNKLSWWRTNPKIDHVEWAISHEDHEYNYEAGKEKFKQALEDEDEDVKDESMAFAWRALGETLHLIADMGIASHVRDDAHPGVGAKYLGGYAYDADPYEEIVYNINKKNDDLSAFSGGSTDPYVRSFSRNSKTAKSIAEQLAAYTNKNFFSHETISGTKVKPKIHPDKTYASPKLEDCEYDEEKAVFTKSFGGNSVIMCKDLSYMSVLNGFRGYPYIDEECVKSQAKALFPQIIEAGANVIRCFIPDIEVTVTNVTTDSIFGTVKHFKDSEYKSEIFYSGTVQIKNFKDKTLLAEVECEDGEFADEIDLSDFDRVNDKLYAEIDCRNIRIKSEPYEEKLYEMVMVGISQIVEGKGIALTEDGGKINSVGLNSYPERPLNWEGSKFSSFKIIEEGDESAEFSAYGELGSGMSIKDLRIRNTWFGGYYVDFIDVPTIVYQDSLVSAIPNGQARQYIEEIEFGGWWAGPATTFLYDNMKVTITFLKTIPDGEMASFEPRIEIEDEE